jgi:hypothetical protein
MVVWIWWQHNQFFRRYGLQDAWTATLNAALLFVVLIYVYPLRFLTTAMTGSLFGVSDAVRDVTAQDGAVLLLFYSTGILLIFAAFVLLHQHAWRRRADLGLTAPELLDLRFHIRSHLISASFAALSIAIVLIVRLLRLPGLVGIAGWIYMLLGPAHAWNGTMQSKTQKALATTSTEKA